MPTNVSAVFARVILCVVKSATYSRGILRELFIVLSFKVSFSLNTLQLLEPVSDGSFTTLTYSGALIIRRGTWYSLPSLPTKSAITRV